MENNNNEVMSQKEVHQAVKNDPEIQNFYLFIQENDLRMEALEALTNLKR